MLLQFPTVRMFGIGLRTWYSNSTTIQRWTNLRLSFSWDKFGGLREKERILGGREEKMKMKRRWGIVGIRLIQYRYLYLGYSQLIIYSIYLFYIKKFYFIFYQMNKLNIYFFSKHYFITTIFIYLFNYKTSSFSKILFTKNGVLQVSFSFNPLKFFEDFSMQPHLAYI